jgi:hypothetical protein
VWAVAGKARRRPEATCDRRSTPAESRAYRPVVATTGSLHWARGSTSDRLRVRRMGITPTRVASWLVPSCGESARPADRGGTALGERRVPEAQAARGAGGTCPTHRRAYSCGAGQSTRPSSTVRRRVSGITERRSGRTPDVSSLSLFEAHSLHEPAPPRVGVE